MEPLTTSPVKWSTIKKISFRFSFIFFLLFIIIENNGAYPLWVVLMKYPQEMLHMFIPWLARNVYHVPYEITVFTNGSGDTTYDYLVVLTIFIAAIIGTIVWSILDSRRANYKTLYYWLTAAIRFYIALMLINYGMVKIIKLQFPYPDFYRLTKTYGDSSPMGLAWTFLGFSKGYNIFMGVAEIAAVLLLFRRTMTAGAIITLMTTTSVMAINYFYDVPVKIVSTMLAAMTLFLLLNDAETLIRFFFKGDKVSLPKIQAPAEKKWMRISKLAVKLIILGFVMVTGFMQSMFYQEQYGENAPKPKLYGLYTVESFVYAGDTLPPLTSDSIRWKHFIVQTNGYAGVQYMDGTSGYFTVKLDTTGNKADLTPTHAVPMHYFHYEVQDSARLRFSGVIGGDSVLISMKRKDLKDFQLMNRGFNWINEYPYNR